MFTPLSKLLSDVSERQLEREGKHFGGNVSFPPEAVAEQSARHGNAGMRWASAVGAVFAKCGERFVKGQKRREGAMKSALQPTFFAAWCRAIEKMLCLPLESVSELFPCNGLTVILVATRPS